MIAIRPVSADKCIFCGIAEHMAPGTSGKCAGVIAAFVMGAACRDGTGVDACLACTAVLRVAIRVQNAAPQDSTSPKPSRSLDS